jgi:cytochrome o ubiquinol oxidase subunit 2
MKRNFILPIFAALLIFGLVGFAWLHGADLRVLNPQGPVGLEERWVIGATIALSALIVIPVFVILFLFAWQYRASHPQTTKKHDPNWDHDNWIAEFIWWLVPLTIVFCLAVIAWQTTHELDPFRPIPGTAAPITIDVVALDWKWLFIYPAQNIASVNMVEFPANTPVHFYITSDAPMNSFWIPSLGGQIMAMPGMTTQLNLFANTSGIFNGFSSNMSGDGFAGMAFSAKSVSSSEFNSWVKSVQATSTASGTMQTTHAGPLNATTYAALAAPSEYNPVTTYSPVDSGLYTASVMKYMMPGM